MMHTTLNWYKVDSINPIVRVEHYEHCGECKKHLIFQMAGNTIEIKMNEEYLAKLSQVIADHPKQMEEAARNKIKIAIAELKKMGISSEEYEQESNKI